jgi:hypothetical protein
VLEEDFRGDLASAVHADLLEDRLEVVRPWIASRVNLALSL